MQWQVITARGLAADWFFFFSVYIFKVCGVRVVFQFSGECYYGAVHVLSRLKYGAYECFHSTNDPTEIFRQHHSKQFALCAHGGNPAY